MTNEDYLALVIRNLQEKAREGEKLSNADKEAIRWQLNEIDELLRYEL